MATSKYPNVKARHLKLWVQVKDPARGWRWERSPYEVGAEPAAAKFRVALQRRLDAGEELGLVEGTVREYAKRWMRERQQTGIASWRDEQGHLDLHILPAIGDMKIAEVRPRQLKEIVTKLRVNKKASRTVRNVYSTARSMFRSAAIEDMIESSPCVLGKNELGTISDADSDWRSTAKFERTEYEALISDARVPHDRRVLYGLLGLGMLRHGEAAGLRWKNVQVEHEPLGRLVIATSYDAGRTKTRRDRWMPIHPVLAAMLAEWKLSGWALEFGRPPAPDDLVLPHTKPSNRGPRVKYGGMRSDHDSYKRLRLDCTALGLRQRRVHDLRRTGITLAREDGAQKDTLRASTHGGAMDIMDVYTSMGWPALCAEVAKIKVRRREQLLVGHEATGS